LRRRQNAARGVRLAAPKQREDIHRTTSRRMTLIMTLLR
jgi:hypothetical protein